MKQLNNVRFWTFVIMGLFAFCTPTLAQDDERDPLQEYLDNLPEVPVQQASGREGLRRSNIVIPSGLTEVDLSNPDFSAYTSRSKVIKVNKNVRFVNGSITAKSNFSGGECLVKVYGGATVAFDETATVDASLASSSKCYAAVGIYDCGYNTTVYKNCDFTAPDNGNGIAIYMECSSHFLYLMSGAINGSIYNPNNGTIIGPDPDPITPDELLEMLNDIQTDISTAETIWNNANDLYVQLADRLPAADYAKVTSKMNELKNAINTFKTRRNNLVNQVNNAAESDFAQLKTTIDQLAADVEAFITSISAQIASLDEQVKGWAATDLGNRLSSAGSTLTGLGNVLNSYAASIAAMLNTSGNYYFEKLVTTAFNNAAISVNADVSANNSALNALISEYNTLLRNNSISSVQDAINFYVRLETLNGKIANLQTTIASTQGEVEALGEQYDALDVNFPGEEECSVRPSGLNKEIQVGYKSNRGGYVLTAGGLLYFEQKEGADFYFYDIKEQYLVAKAGRASLTSTDDVEEATVWTGQSLGNGSYTFYSKEAGRYMAFVAGTDVNAPVTTSTSAYAWQIIEPGVDPFQAAIYMLDEEKTLEQNNPGDQPTDTLYVYIPGSTGPRTTPIVIPCVGYPIYFTGLPNPTPVYFPIPRPSSGYPGENYHPIYIERGSHVIFDNLLFNDLVGGHHVIYVDGILEINVTVNIVIQNWQWFIHVGPNGRVIWHNDGDNARPIWNEGTFDMVEGTVDRIDNSGRVNHTGGTVIDIINRNIYYFIGGLAHHALNWGNYYHQGGQVITARNFQGGTYEMTGGSVNNTVKNYADTVFVNLGTFRFKGGIIRGYGGRLIYHGPGAYMWIDGGTFNFSNIRNYFIEAHSDFYIRGNYNYGATKPILLAPEVVIRILYKWTYKFNIVFIDGRPVPRHPLFWGDGFTLQPSHYQYIDWDLPNHRWRWYINVTDNTIEPRDEEVYDEDDFQAYLDWLDTNPDGEADCTEDNPQVLDLGGRTIVLSKPVTIPTGKHVFIKNGSFRPVTSWAYDKFFIVPSGCSLRMDYITINMGDNSYYHVNGTPVQRCLFDIAGHAWFGNGFVVNGYYDRRYTATDTFIPGAMVNIGVNARVIIDGALFNNVVFRVSNVVGLYFRSAVAGYFHIYVPSAYRYDGFRIFGPWGGYRLQDNDANMFMIIPSDNEGGDTPMAVEVDEDGYGELTDDFLIGDVNCDGILSITDVACITQYIMGEMPPIFRLAAADVNGDGDITVSDTMALVDLVLH